MAMDGESFPTGERQYAARLDVDYPEQLSRLTTFFRPLLILPIVVILTLVTASGTSQEVITQSGDTILVSAGFSIATGLALATALMIAFREKYPKWWYDFALELNRFSVRVFAYGAFLTDTYPSADEEQSVHLELDYPDASQLNRWLPLVKWILAIPHFVVLALLGVGAAIAIVIAWFAILFTGNYPRALFDYVVAVMRWVLRVAAYCTLLITDEYPPFSLN